MKRQGGFTIVEVLIVIVVIAILATVVTIIYTSMQERATLSRLEADLRTNNNAIQLYRAEYGNYPSTAGVWKGYNSVTNDNFIPGVAPKYFPTTPQVFVSAAPPAYPSFIYRSFDGTDYKLLYIVSGTDTLPLTYRTNNPFLDPVRPTRAWGYWSSGDRNT